MSARLLISQRAAARLLGCSPDTLAAARRAGALRTVPWLGRWRVPLAEVERLGREGMTITGRRPRAAKRSAPRDAADAVRALDVEAL